jgi:hypothetical protein
VGVLKCLLKRRIFCLLKVLRFTFVVSCFFLILQDIEHIGSGQYGNIFKCTHKYLYNKEVVCVKIKRLDEESKEAFLSEYKAGKFFRKFDDKFIIYFF